MSNKLIQVEREKLGTAEDQNQMFARLAGRVRELNFSISIIWAVSSEKVSLNMCSMCRLRSSLHEQSIIQGQVVQSVISLTSSLRVISLTVIVDSIYNILIFFAEKM